MVYGLPRFMLANTVALSTAIAHFQYKVHFSMIALYFYYLFVFNRLCIVFN